VFEIAERQAALGHLRNGSSRAPLVADRSRPDEATWGRVWGQGRRMTCVESVPYALEKPGADKAASTTSENVSAKQLS
jgi:hypothetical protein